MSSRRLVPAVLMVVLLVVAAVWVYAQGPVTPALPVQAPTVIAGPDLGFRVESRRGTTPIGTLVVRVNGQWVEAEFAGGVKRLSAR